jgi:dihydropteridine reductase
MSAGRVLVYGGRGALGSACVEHFRSKGWKVFSVDIHHNDKADANIILDAADTVEKQAETVKEELGKHLGEGNKLDGIICVAGGWAGGNAASKDFLKNSNLMWQQSVQSSLVSASLAPTLLKEGGVLVLTGAQSALKPTPGMIGYGLAKAAVHHLTQSLGAPKSGLPTGATALAILPVTLDTPNNRKWMPNADTSTWTPLGFIAELFEKWLTSEDKPKSGSLVQLLTKDGVTNLVVE